jgi:hypothetical protein
LIKQETGAEPELVVGGRGEFTVWVGEDRVAQKGPEAFPSEEEILSAVRKVLNA